MKLQGPFSPSFNRPPCRYAMDLAKQMIEPRVSSEPILRRQRRFSFDGVSFGKDELFDSENMKELFDKTLKGENGKQDFLKELEEKKDIIAPVIGPCKEKTKENEISLTQEKKDLSTPLIGPSSVPSSSGLIPPSVELNKILLERIQSLERRETFHTCLLLLLLFCFFLQNTKILTNLTNFL